MDEDNSTKFWRFLNIAFAWACKHFLQGLVMATNTIYNNNFNESTNVAVEGLIRRTSTSPPPRINRKNGSSLLDTYFQFIFQKLSEHKTQGQILSLLNAKFSIKVNKSTLSRFLKKKMGS